MTSLTFLACLGAIITFVLALEADNGLGLKIDRRPGLLVWLVGGNWPAKIGGILIIVGVGALLRYALINIEIAPQLKLGGGIVIALALALGSNFVPAGAAKRPVSLALGGAAFGVAYLTAYSAFGLFHYLSNPMGLALLGLTAVGAGFFAITRGALSLALLAMVGAYLAPAFAVQDPGPLIVYGYFAAASLLTLAMVTARGWRALIHLSFLFTLAGSLFFGWTSHYYTADHATVMLPMLVLLAAIHVAMPIVEKATTRTTLMERLDVAYTLILPITVALLSVFVATNRNELSLQLAALSMTWGFAAVALMFLSRSGIAIHVVVSILLMMLAFAARIQDLPWELILLSLSVGSLAVAARKEPTPGRLHNILAGFILLFAALHVLASVVTPITTEIFFNRIFVERIIAAVLLIVGGTICRRIKQSLDTLLLAVGVLWLFVAVGAELIRWNLATLALIAHWFTILVAASLWIPGRRFRAADNHTIVLLISILATAWWASFGATELTAIIAFCAASLVLVAMAFRPHHGTSDRVSDRAGAALVAPVVGFIWSLQIGSSSDDSQIYFAATLATSVAVVTLIVGRFATSKWRYWLDDVSDVFLTCFATAVLMCTVVSISRHSWSISLEVACLAGLATATSIRHWRRRATDLSVVACMAAVALILQANLMRVFAPPGHLDITDVLQLRWPAAISLLWAAMGCALTIWSRKVSSRALWSSGAILLVAAAVKLLLVDFGSLGQLANILAVIAAGGIFLTVGWLAPMPPAQSKIVSRVHVTAPSVNDDPEDDELDDMVLAVRQRNTWSIAVVLVFVVLMFDAKALPFKLFGHLRSQATAIHRDQAVIAPASLNTDADAENEKEPPNLAGEVAYIEKTPSEVPVTLVNSNVTPSNLQASSDLNGDPVRIPIPPTVAATKEVKEPRPYVAPPTVDANGVRTYTQYSLPQSRHASAPFTPEPADKGIDQLLRAGSLRRALRSDIQLFIAASGSDKRVPPLHQDPNGSEQSLYRIYVVTGEMTFPEGLFGAHSATFIVPRGVPRPTGNPGHSRVLEIP